MRFRLPSALLLFICLAPFGGAAPVFPQEVSDLPADPAVRWGRLENGLRYAIRANREPKGRVSLRFAVAAGSLEETEAQRGLAHFLEHMAFNGSTHFAPGTLVEYFQRLGMSFGGDTNAFTAFDRTEYQIELPDTKPETVDRALTLFADYGGGLLLEPKSIEKERGIILSEKRARDSVDYREFVDELKFLLPKARLPERMPIGLEEVVEHAQRPLFADFYNAWYRPDNVLVAVVGDIDPAAVERLIRKDLSALAPRAPLRPKPPLDTVAPSEGIAARLHTEPDAPEVQVSIETVVPHRDPPDLAAVRLRRLPRDLAVAMLNRRLQILAKKDGAPFTGGEADVEDEYHIFRNAAIGVTCKPEQWRPALALADQELRRALEYGFQPAELREAVAGARRALEEAVRSAPTRRSPDLADALVDAVIDNKVFTNPETNLALYGPYLEKVTAADCLEAFRAAWSAAGGRRIYIAGDLRLADSGKEILAAYGASEAAAVSPPARVAEEKFAYTDFGPAGKAAQTARAADLGIVQVCFDNGVRLDLKRTPFEAGRVRVNVRVGGGRLTEPPGKPGLGAFASFSFALGGLGRHGFDDLQRLLAGKTVEFNFSEGDDAFNLAGVTSWADLPLELQVLCAYVSDPGYRPEAQRLVDKQIDEAYNEFAHTVEGPFQTVVPRLMASGDPRFGLPSRNDALARNLEEVRGWLAPQLASGAIEVAIVGDFDEAAATAAVARTFGALPARSPKPAYAAERRVSFPARPFARTYAMPTEIPRGIVDLRWPATDGSDVRRTRRLDLLAEVFMDRLRVKLREQMGDTYSPEAAAELSKTFTGYGFIEAEAAVAPDKTAVVVAAIKGVAGDLAKNGVTEDELRRAREPAMTSIRESLRSNRYWLDLVLAASQEHPEWLDWCRSRVADYGSITKAELDALAARYLDPEESCVFISVPEKPR